MREVGKLRVKKELGECMEQCKALQHHVTNLATAIHRDGTRLEIHRISR